MYIEHKGRIEPKDEPALGFIFLQFVRARSRAHSEGVVAEVEDVLPLHALAGGVAVTAVESAARVVTVGACGGAEGGREGREPEDKEEHVEEGSHLRGDVGVDEK
ncbi:hypothetical protein QR680_005681 [Steinernema hermaphroditum]|uniref:Uncharacterized protein n=1 Tax=Steinernema hermaphroditum TaxID=289476 RepID=A0AA39HVD2_9BILA|nr:hypothetical protein QR680_005681 [Steinernema hermaphroditum]